MSNIAPPTPAATAARPWRAARALARAAAWLTVAAASLLLLAWLTLHWAILPHIERWRPLVEAKAGEALGITVRIGAIEVRSGGLAPSVELRDVTLIDDRQRTALQLARVTASVSPGSLLASLGSFELRLAQLLIDGAQLDIRRDAAGRLFVAGLEFSGATADSETNAADWFFRQQEIAIRGASLRWTDELRQAPPLELHAVDLVVRNTLRQHELRLDATPPAAWGERFSLRGEFTQPLLARSGDWEGWSGEAYVDAPRADVGELRRYLDLPFELSEGAGAVRAWLDVGQGRVNAITLDLALRAVTLRLGAQLEPLAVQQLKGRLKAQRRADGGSVSLEKFEFLTGDGVQWPAGDLAFTWTRGADGAPGKSEFTADRLDLAVIAQTASRLPLGEAIGTLLAEARPRGIVSAVKAAWDGPLAAPTHYRVKAELSGLSLDAKPAARAREIGRPGLRNATLALDATDAGGEARVATKHGALDLPGVFAEPLLPFDAFDARLRWRIDIATRAGSEPALHVEISDARFANADLQGALNARWQTGAAPASRLPGTLELDGTLSRALAARTARYLPLALPTGARRYVQRAVLGGNVTRASFRVKGDLADFPFADGTVGEFRIALAADDMTLAYVPSVAAPLAPSETAFISPWPPMTQLSGELVLDRTALEFRDARAQILGVQLDGLHGGIAALGDKPVLTLATQARGPLAGVLHFVNTTPIGGWTGGALRETTADGEAELKLSLTLPLNALDRSSVDGSLVLAGNELRLRPDLPPLSATRGRIAFTNKGFAITDASARVLGGETTIAGGTQADGSLRLNAQGSINAEALRRTPELGALARLAGALSGQAGYRLSLGLVQGVPEIELTSDLAGLAIDLPPPLKKPAETALPLHFQTARAPGAQLDTLRIELGPVLQLHYQRDLAGSEPRVLRGGIGIFEPAPTPASGVAAAATLTSLDLDAWSAATERLLGPDSTTSGATAPSGYAPSQIGLKAQTLTVAARTLTRVTAGLSRLDGQWRANIDADQVNGYAEYRAPAGDGSQSGRVYARLARLSLPKSDADEVAGLLERQPRSVPALDIVIDALELRGRPLGRFEVLAVNRYAPEREWELTRLKLALPEAQLSASGRWGAVAGSARTAGAESKLNFELDIADSGALLTRFGTPDAVRGGKGKIAGQLGWQGSPLSPELQSLAGQFNIAIEAGQFLQVRPGAARLLGVLSMQSLARRLTGDFRDLFHEGFAFDSITGDVAIAHGVARTEKIAMRGAQAAVLMEGSADIVRETQDLRVLVLPEINLGAASLAYAMVNPVVGLGSFVAQWLLREPLAQASSREFRITGPWAEPQVEPVERTAAPNRTEENPR